MRVHHPSIKWLKKEGFDVFDGHYTHSESGLFLSKENIEEQLPEMNEFPYS